MEATDLKKAGLKATLPRIRILQILEESEGKHLSAEDVYKILLGHGEEVGLATVYRVLTQFEAAGLVIRHNHMVHLDTGEIIEFQNEEIEELQKKIAKKHGFELVEHSLVLYVRSKK